MPGFAPVSKEGVLVKGEIDNWSPAGVSVPGMDLRQRAAVRKEWQNSSRKLPN